MTRDRRRLSEKLLRLLTGIALLFMVHIAAQAQDDDKKVPPETGEITGRVVNENGQPISRAIIYVTAPLAPIQSRNTSSDDVGNFRVSGLDALVYTVNASVPAYVTPPRDRDSLPTYYRLGDSLTISLIKGGIITGAVTSSIGEPLVQVAVRATLVRDVNGKPATPGRFGVDRFTDDRGVYRFYGLLPGTYVVSAGGRGSYWYAPNPYDTDAPTYAPSSTRDAAAEITVNAGEEVSGVDIRYRGEPGHAVSGFASGLSAPNFSTPTNITLTQIVNGVPQASAFSFQAPNSKGFAFYGIADGDYDLIAQSTLPGAEVIASEARHIKVKGADVTGIELVVKSLGAISGHITLEPSTANDCKNKRRPSLSEILLVARPSGKNTPTDQLAFPVFLVQAAPNKDGDFVMRNLTPGQFNLSARFFAKYWYLRSIVRDASGVKPAAGKEATPSQAARQTDAARNGVNLKFGERISGLTLTLAEGAASLRGSIKPAAGGIVPPKLSVYFVPTEKAATEDVLRFFAAPVNADGTFALNNLPPGRYWALARFAVDDEPQSDSQLRAPEEADARVQVRRAAETANQAVELKPCQNVIDYQLPFKISAPKKLAKQMPNQGRSYFEP